jgi:hypothetical protein
MPREVMSYISAGQGAKFAIGYQVYGGAKLASLTVGFAIQNKHQQFIALCQNN